MPWTGQEFASRHNHALHGEKATHAAHIADAMLRDHAPEGIAIATANKWAEHHDDGGGIGAPSPSIGGPTPSAQTMNPMMQSLIQRYASMPTEKLTEYAAMLGGTPQGQVIQKLLAQRRMMPNTAPQAPQAPQTPAVALPQPGQPMGQPTQAQPAPGQGGQGGQGYRRGGTVKRDMGGMMPLSMADPWWTRAEARGSDSSGFLHGTTGGQADAVKTQAPAGSFVVPAEVVAGLGEGNNLAGARVMQAILDSGPHGTPLPRGERGRGPPRPPAVPAEDRGGLKDGGEIPIFEAKARGGAKEPGKTPVDLSHGEFVISPEHVKAWGGGDTDRGIRILNRWVWKKHQEHIKDLKTYKGPVGMKKADKT